jgi:phospholipase/lecithinase/hemolysin
LADALQRDPEGVLGRARQAAQPGALRPAAAEVYAQLVGKAKPPQARQTTISAGKTNLAVVQFDARGGATITIAAGQLVGGRAEQLSALLKAFLTSEAPS